jgi:hypothetical protein
MKKILLIIGVALFATTASANGKKPSVFGASLKPVPSVTLFGQTLKWEIPSLCLGKAAGVLPDARVSAEGISFKLPWLAVDIPLPSFVLRYKTNKVELKLGEVNKVAHVHEEE